MKYEFKEKPEYDEKAQELYPKYSLIDGTFIVGWQAVDKDTNEIIVLGNEK